MAYPTNPIYKFITDPITGTVNGVKTETSTEVKLIPINEENTNYQEYLAWVAEGNTAEEAD
tara:strand:+ start:1281 stop:1463 length:183 start_codon:yes stop_codon:yes gene_type:complete